jgi:hypothetical protein
MRAAGSPEGTRKLRRHEGEAAQAVWSLAEVTR